MAIFKWAKCKQMKIISKHFYVPKYSKHRSFYIPHTSLPTVFSKARRWHPLSYSSPISSETSRHQGVIVFFPRRPHLLLFINFTPPSLPLPFAPPSLSSLFSCFSTPSFFLAYFPPSFPSLFALFYLPLLIPLSSTLMFHPLLGHPARPEREDEPNRYHNMK